MQCKCFKLFHLQEPPADFTLAQHPKVVATPHLGASTSEAQERVAVEIAEQFVDLAKGKKLFGAVCTVDDLQSLKTHFKYFQ